jgi:Tol biopolymer transport system component
MGRFLKLNKLHSYTVFVLSLLSISACNLVNTAKTTTPKPSASTSLIAPIVPINSSKSPSPSPSPVTKEFPDKIAFMSNRNGFWDIYTMNPDGSLQSQLTNDDMKNPYAFSISPDGKKLAYISDKSGNADLWLMNLENMEKKQVTNTENAEEGSPAWTPDSENIVFHSNENAKDLYEILQVKYSLSGTYDFKTVVTNQEFNVLHPSYSPNGNYLMYSISDKEGNNSIYIYDFTDQKEIQLTQKEDNAINGSWYTDSTKIIYWTNNSGIYQVNTNGTGKMPIGTFKNIKGVPFYSLDGKRITVARGFGYSEDFNVWVMDNDGRNAQKLTNLGGISLNWFKNSKVINPVPTATPSSIISDGNPYSPYNPYPSVSSGPYIDPNDPLLNP